MTFTFYTNETEEVLSLIGKSFDLPITQKEIPLQENQRILLLKDGNKVVGATMIAVKNDPIQIVKSYYLDYVCIDKDYRNQGLGEKLLTEVFRLAKEEGINAVQLTSNKNRVEARNIYNKLGFEIIDTDIFIKRL